MEQILIRQRCGRKGVAVAKVRGVVGGAGPCFCPLTLRETRARGTLHKIVGIVGNSKVSKLYMYIFG